MSEYRPASPKVRPLADQHRPPDIEEGDARARELLTELAQKLFRVQEEVDQMARFLQDTEKRSQKETRLNALLKAASAELSAYVALVGEDHPQYQRLLVRYGRFIDIEELLLIQADSTTPLETPRTYDTEQVRVLQAMSTLLDDMEAPMPYVALDFSAACLAQKELGASADLLTGDEIDRLNEEVDERYVSFVPERNTPTRRNELYRLLPEMLIRASYDDPASEEYAENVHRARNTLRHLQSAWADDFRSRDQEFCPMVQRYELLEPHIEQISEMIKRYRDSRGEVK